MSTPATDNERRILIEQVKLLYRQGSSGITATPILATIAVPVLWDAINRSGLIIWYGVMMSVVALRYLLVILYRRSETQDSQVEWWRDVFTGLALLTATGWGFLGSVMFPAAGPLHQVFVIVIISGISAGAVSLLSTLRRICFPFLFLISAPLVARLVLTGEPLLMVIGATIAIYALIMFRAAQNAYQTTLQTFTLGFENMALVEELSAANAQQKAANQQLMKEAAERKQAQKELQQGRDFLELIMESAMSAIFVLDAEGNYIRANPAGAAMAGYTVDELIGENVSLVCTPETLKRLEANMVYIVEGRETVTGLETEIVRKDGSHRTLLMTAGPLFEGDELIGIVGSSIDITDRKRAEEEMVAAKEEAERASDAKSEFLSQVSHELRTPLNAILGFAQLAEADAAETEDRGQAENAHEILVAGQHLLSLIDDVLDLSSIESGELSVSMEGVRLSDVVNDCLHLMRPFADDRNIAVLDNIGPKGHVVVIADLVRLKQVLLNLLSNAIKYGFKGGRVTLELDLEQSDWACLRVTDTGPGIADRDQEKLFEPFERLGARNSDIEGSGLGLALTKRLVESMGGQIRVESLLGKGSCFEVKLRRNGASGTLGNSLSQSELHGVAKEDNARTEGSVVGTVLYIEDNPSNLKFVQKVIETRRPGIVLLPAHAPQLGLDLAAAHRPDFILLDIGLPDMDGFEVLAQLSKNPKTASIPVVALSANAMPRDIERGLAAGFTEYLTKPIDVSRLLETLDRFIPRSL